MKRNWDTIREILIKLDELDSKAGSIQLSDFPKEKDYEYSYHIELLLDAGLINGKMMDSLGRQAQSFIIESLTWNGHEFLDTIIDDNVWNKTKSTFKEGGLSMTLDLAKEVATNITLSLITKLSTGS